MQDIQEGRKTEYVGESAESMEENQVEQQYQPHCHKDFRAAVFQLYRCIVQHKGHNYRGHRHSQVQGQNDP